MCDHVNFKADVHVNRLVNDDSVIFVAELRVVCADCGQAFIFGGLPNGTSSAVPTTNYDKSVARIPMTPPPNHQ